MLEKGLNSLYTGNPERGSLANSEDPDEMPQNAEDKCNLQDLKFMIFLKFLPVTPQHI